eukprot:COSAG04_NODE_168_length_21684_cov_19.787121_11_plen_505_part_00
MLHLCESGSCSVPARLLQVLLVMAAAGYGGRAEFSEKYHQLGEPGVVTVVTATTGKAELARCVESVRAQRYRGAIQHLVVVDGEEFVEAARAALATLERPTAPSPPYARCEDAPHVKNSPCGAVDHGGDLAQRGGAEAPWAGPRWLDVVYLPFNMHGDGGRVYTAGPNLARGAFVSNLDEDNYFAPEHISSLVELIVGQELDWAFSLRKLAMHGEPLAYDRCESLGPQHEVWNWDGEPNFSAAHSQYHVDTNSYMARRPVALALAPEWNCLPRHNDRCYLEAATAAFPKHAGTGGYSVFYDIDPSTEKGLSLLGFFSEGLRAMHERHPAGYPWEGDQAPPPLPLHPGCAGFTEAKPFFCEADGAAQPAAEECEEGWSGPDCLQCAEGFAGDFCRPIAAAAEAQPLDSGGGEVAQEPPVPPTPAAKRSARKGKSKKTKKGKGRDKSRKSKGKAKGVAAGSGAKEEISRLAQALAQAQVRDGTATHSWVTSVRLLQRDAVLWTGRR